MIRVFFNATDSGAVFFSTDEAGLPAVLARLRAMGVSEWRVHRSLR